MQADIVVPGIPRMPNAQENARKVAAALGAFRNRYPGAILEEPEVKALGKSSQTIAFVVTAADLGSAQAMQAFFERALVDNGFFPTPNAEDAQAVAEDLLRRMGRDKA